jgi:hypothetical protein
LIEPTSPGADGPAPSSPANAADTAPSRRAGADGAAPPRALGEAALYLALTLLAWGLLAVDRGFFQDDTALLARTLICQDFLHRLFIPFSESTRYLIGWPYALALLSDWPRIALQALYGAVWLGIGLAARAIARQLFPESAWVGFAAGALTLCATSDYLTNSLVASSYNLSILAFLLATWCLLRWRPDGASPAWLAAAALALNASVWMTDAAFAALFLVPGLLWVADGCRRRRRQLVAAAVWYGAAAPYLVGFLRFLGGDSYVSRALVTMGWKTRWLNLARLAAFNFTPWRWILRPNWAAPPPALLGNGFRLAVAGIGTVLFLAAALYLRPEAGSHDRSAAAGRRRFVAGVLACLLLMLAANVIFVSAPFAEFYYRTHLLSRVWASLALAAVGWRLAGGGLKAVALSLLGAFVFCGLYSAIERQDYYLGYWRRQRGELRSIVEQVPGLRPEATLVLLLPVRPRSSYVATEVQYLAGSWCRLLYRVPPPALLVWSLHPAARLQCGFTRTALACADPTAGPARRIPLDRLVLMRYDPAGNRYQLLRSIPQDLDRGPAGEGSGRNAGRVAYDPAALIVARPLSPMAQDLLYQPELVSPLLGIPPVAADRAGRIGAVR